MITGTVYNVGENYYEVISREKNKIKLRFINYTETTRSVKIPVRLKKEGFKFKQWELVDVPDLSSKRTTVGLSFATFKISQELLNNRKVDYRLTLNNLIARLLLGQRRAKTLLNGLVLKRINNGKTESNKEQSGSSERGN